MVYTATKIVSRKIGSDSKVWHWKVVNCPEFDSVVEHVPVTCVGENLTNHALGSSYSYKKIMHNVCITYYMEEI